MGQTERSTGTGDEQTIAHRAAVMDLPPSAKLVVKVLERNDTLSQQELAEETLLPPRTVRYALGRLRDEDLVQSQFSFADARKRRYSLID